MARHCCETVYCEGDCGRSRHWCEVGDSYVCRPCRKLHRDGFVAFVAAYGDKVLDDGTRVPSPATSDTKGDTP